MKKYIEWFKNLDLAYKLIIGVVVFVIAASVYGRVITANENDALAVKEQALMDYIEAPQNYTPVGVSEFRNISQGNVERYDVVVTFDPMVSMDSIDMEIRHRMFQLIKKHQDADELSVRCFGEAPWPYEKEMLVADGEYKLGVFTLHRLDDGKR